MQATLEEVTKVVKSEIEPLRVKIGIINDTLHGKADDRDDLGLVGDVRDFKRIFKVVIGFGIALLLAVLGNIATSLMNNAILQSNAEKVYKVQVVTEVLDESPDESGGR